MKRNEKFESILEECITRVIEYNESIDVVAEAYPRWKDQLKVELETALWLYDQSEYLDPRPGFVTSSQQHLISQLIVTNLQNQFRYSAFRGTGFLPRLALTVLIVLAVFLGGGSVAFAAEDSLPGEALYTIRISTEYIWLALTLQPSKDAQLHLQFAQEHLTACAIVASQGRYEDAHIALQNYERHMAGAGRLVPVLSRRGLIEAETLFVDFNRIYLQDIETIQVLLPGEF